MRLAACCFVSAVLGALVTVTLTQSWSTFVVAQEQQGTTRFPVAQAEAGPASPRKVNSRVAEAPAPRDASQSENDFDLTPEERVNIRVYERTNRSVVHITTKTSRAEGLFAVEVPGEEAGSGSIIDADGHILTNYHVIENAKQATVTLHDGKSYEAKYVGGDTINDVAVIKIEAPRDVLEPVTFGDSGKLQVGMRVYAIGNPFGLERTLTTGVISSLNRSLPVAQNRTIKSVIQIDAAINPGNSGGPLLDTHGRLIGMNTAIATRTGQSAGVAFAIPINLIARIVPQLLEHGRIIRPDLGVPRLYQTDAGLLVAELAPRGPAEKAGVKGPQIVSRRRGPFVYEQVDRSAADIIVGINGKRVKSSDDLYSMLESLKPGDVIQLSVIRQGKVIQIPVVLGSDEENVGR